MCRTKETLEKSLNRMATVWAEHSVLAAFKKAHDDQVRREAEALKAPTYDMLARIERPREFTMKITRSNRHD